MGDGTEIRNKPHTSPLVGTEAVPLSPDGYATTNEIAALAVANAGVPIVRAFSFAYNTPNLATGAAIYTPTVGDVVLDAWIEIDTAWNGTTPKFDFGRFFSHTGWLKTAFVGDAAIDFTKADTSALLGAGTLSQNDAGMQNTLMSEEFYRHANTLRYLPTKFTTADPILVCVSQDGTDNGGDPGASQGAATLFLVTATPGGAGLATGGGFPVGPLTDGSDTFEITAAVTPGELAVQANGAGANAQLVTSAQGFFELSANDGTTSYEVFQEGAPGGQSMYGETQDIATNASGRWEQVAAANAAISSLNTDDGLGHAAALSVVSAGGSSEVTAVADGHTYLDMNQAGAGSIKFNDNAGGIFFNGTGGFFFQGTFPTSDPHVDRQVYADGYVQGVTPGILKISAG